MNKLKEKITKKRFAWQVYKYFIKNEFLLNDEKYLQLFEKSKEILMEYYKDVGNRADTENSMHTLALMQNKYEPEDFTLTEEIAYFILH